MNARAMRNLRAKKAMASRQLEDKKGAPNLANVFGMDPIQRNAKQSIGWSPYDIAMAPTGLGPTLPGIKRPPNWRVAEDYSVVPASFYAGLAEDYSAVPPGFYGTGLGFTSPVQRSYQTVEEYANEMFADKSRFDPYGTPSGRPYVEGFEGISPDVLQEIAKRWGETYGRREAELSPWRVLAMMSDPGHPDRWPDNAPPRGWFNDPIVSPWSADRHLLGERAWPQDKFQDYIANYIDAMANVPMPRQWYEDYSANPFESPVALPLPFQNLVVEPKPRPPQWR